MRGARGGDELDVHLAPPSLKPTVIVVPCPQPVGQHGAQIAIIAPLMVAASVPQPTHHLARRPRTR